MKYEKLKSVTALIMTAVVLGALFIPARAFFFSKKEQSAVYPDAAAASKLDTGSPPIAEDLSLETYQNVLITGKFEASDPEGSPLIFTITEKPKLGELNIEGDIFTFIPYLGRHGSDYFLYTATDSDGNTSNVARVTLTVKNRLSKSSFFYSDMADNPAHYAAIRLYEENVFKGERIGRECFFRPEKHLTRAEFLAIASEISGMEVASVCSSTTLSDNAETASWARPFISAALKTGLIQGSESADGQIVFRADDPITRAEAAVIINGLLNITDVSSALYFNDMNEIPAWAVSAASNLSAHGFIDENAQGCIRPNDFLTRAEAATLFYETMCQLKPTKPHSRFSFWFD